MLSNGTRFHINDVLYYSKSTRNLLSFKDIHKNGYYIETTNEGNIECLLIDTKHVCKMYAYVHDEYTIKQ